MFIVRLRYWFYCISQKFGSATTFAYLAATRKSRLSSKIINQLGICCSIILFTYLPSSYYSQSYIIAFISETIQNDNEEDHTNQRHINEASYSAVDPFVETFIISNWMQRQYWQQRWSGGMLIGGYCFYNKQKTFSEMFLLFAFTVHIELCRRFGFVSFIPWGRSFFSYFVIALFRLDDVWGGLLIPLPYNGGSISCTFFGKSILNFQLLRF